MAPDINALLTAMFSHPEQAELIARHHDDPEIADLLAQMGAADVQESLSLPEEEIWLRALLEDIGGGGFTGQITDAAGRKRSYVNGKQVANHGSDEQAELKGSEQHPPVSQEELQSLAQSLPKEDRGAWGKVRSVYGKVRDSLFSAALSVSLKVGEHAGDVLDTAEEFARNSLTKAHDPIQSHLGMSAGSAIAITSAVLSRAAVWLKNRRGTRTESLESLLEAMDAGRDWTAMAEAVIQILLHLNQAMGIDAPLPSEEEVIESLKARSGEAE